MLIRFLPALVLAGVLLCVQLTSASAQTIDEVNPDQSTLDPIDPDGASGGRVNGLAVVRGDNQVFYAASEWGGLYKSTDAGLTWFRLERHLPVATWDVEVDPRETDRVYATSFYDGRVNSLAGINVSTDAGSTWIHPATAMPPEGFCDDAARREEPSAFGIGIDPDEPADVYIGTNCGLAISNDAGLTWNYVDPTPDDPATDVWDVVVHHRGIVDLCGDDGHFRSTNGGATWSTGVGLPSGTCSIAASPHERTVLFVTVGNNIYESDDGGGSWTLLGTPDSRRQGRIPFVATNARSQRAFDLWYGDVSLFRGACVSGGAALRCPMAFTGAPGSPPPAGWAGPFTRNVGGHDDVGDIAFDAQQGEQNACPVLFSSDGGVYFNTVRGGQECHTPAWEQPTITPHALWLWALSGADDAGPDDEFLYFGNQDNGTFATVAAGAANPSWDNRQCCDGFDDSSDTGRVLYTVCCFGGAPANRLFLRNPGMIGGGEINSYPPGTLPGFRPIDVIDQFGPDDYVVVTTAGVFVSSDIGAAPVVWTQLGAATSPAGACGVKAADSGGTPLFYVQVGSCNGRNPDQLWVFSGINPAGAWQQVLPPDGGFGIFAVDPSNGLRLYASNLAAAGPQMIRSDDGGATWANDAQLDDLMTGSGAFRYQNRRGPTSFTGFGGYPQPTLVAFDPLDSNIVVAGGADSGLFLSTSGGASWTLVTDPIDSGNSGVAHIPRPWFAYFDHEPDSDLVNIFIGTQGKGVWRIGVELPQPQFEYAAKIVCGLQPDAENTRLVQGFYGTAINILNPNREAATFTKSLSLTYPPDEQAPGEVLPISEDQLGPDQALEVDCIDIERRLFPNGLPTSYIKGFVVIRSTQSLDVVGVYSSGALDTTRCCDKPAILHSSVDVEYIPERLIEGKEPPDGERPDLVPVAPFPPPPANNLSALPQNFCLQPPDGGQPARTIRTIVRNVGPVPAAASTTRVEFFPAGSNVPVASPTQPTPMLGPGGDVSHDFEIPQGCYLGESSCNFRITVDAMGAVDESNEGNNVVESFCPGVVS